MRETVLAVRHMTKVYHTGWFRRKTVLKDFSMAFEKGRVYALLGRNGAGKTTLLNGILGLHGIDSGEVCFLGEPVTPKNEHLMLRRVTSVPTAAEMHQEIPANVLVSAWRSWYPEWDGDLERRIRTLSGCDWSRPLRTLSTGQRMQVLQALALCPRPDVLILDEPVGVTDPVVRKYFYKNVIDLVAARNTTVILATHLIGEVVNLFDEALFMKDGRIVERGSMDTLTGRYRRFRMETLPDSMVAGERGRMLAENALLSDDPGATRADLAARGVGFVEEDPTVEDLFEVFA